MLHRLASSSLDTVTARVEGEIFLKEKVKEDIFLHAKELNVDLKCSKNHSIFKSFNCFDFLLPQTISPDI